MNTMNKEEYIKMKKEENIIDVMKRVKQIKNMNKEEFLSQFEGMMFIHASPKEIKFVKEKAKLEAEYNRLFECCDQDNIVSIYERIWMMSFMFLINRAGSTYSMHYDDIDDLKNYSHEISWMSEDVINFAKSLDVTFEEFEGDDEVSYLILSAIELINYRYTVGYKEVGIISEEESLLKHFRY